MHNMSACIVVTRRGRGEGSGEEKTSTQVDGGMSGGRVKN